MKPLDEIAAPVQKVGNCLLYPVFVIVIFTPERGCKICQAALYEPKLFKKGVQAQESVRQFVFCGPRNRIIRDKNTPNCLKLFRIRRDHFAIRGFNPVMP